MTEKMKIDLTNRSPVLICPEEWEMVVFETLRTNEDRWDRSGDFENGAMWARKDKKGRVIAGLVYESEGNEIATCNIVFEMAELFLTYDEGEAFEYITLKAAEVMNYEGFGGIAKTKKFLRALKSKTLAALKPEEI